MYEYSWLAHYFYGLHYSFIHKYLLDSGTALGMSEHNSKQNKGFALMRLYILVERKKYTNKQINI